MGVLLWPFLGIYHGLRRFRLKRYRLLILVFIVIASYLTLSYEFGDIMLYKNTYEDIVNKLGINSWLDLGLVFLGNEGNFELFIPINVYIVSIFTENLAYSYALTGLVYYFIWSKLIIELVKDYDAIGVKAPRKMILLLICFSVYIIFFRVINGRFYLAYWLAILSIYFIIYKKRNIYYFLLAGCILIHQSYVFILLLVMFFQVLRGVRKWKQFDLVLIFLFIIGSIFSELSIDLVSRNLDFFSTSIQDNYGDYVKESYVEGQVERDKKWFLVWRTPMLFYASFLLLIRLRYAKSIFLSQTNYTFFQFVLIFGVINSFTYAIPSFGERFRNVLIGFVILALFKIYNENRNLNFKTHLNLVLLFFIFYKIVTIRVFAEYINIYAYVPLPTVFDALDDGGYSLYDLIY